MEHCECKQTRWHKSNVLLSSFICIILVVVKYENWQLTIYKINKQAYVFADQEVVLFSSDTYTLTQANQQKKLKTHTHKW